MIRWDNNIAQVLSNYLVNVLCIRSVVKVGLHINRGPIGHQTDVGKAEIALVRYIGVATYCRKYVAHDFAFRNENSVAQRNSERARRKPSTASVTPPVRPGRASKSASPPFIDFSGQLAETEHPWLQDQAYKTIPKKVSQLVLDRLIDRYFYDWIIVPADKGVAVGHLAQVPSLYISSRSARAKSAEHPLIFFS